jgi:hypothetical protein
MVKKYVNVFINSGCHKKAAVLLAVGGKISAPSSQ